MTLRRYRFVTQSIVLSLTFVAALAAASTVQKLSFERLVDTSDVIVEGRVAEVKPRRSPDGSFSTTRVAVTVAEQFKGKKVPSVVIEQPGGPIGDVVQGSPGMPDFSADEPVIIFLQRHTRETYSVVGGKQGKFTVATESGGDRKLVEDFAHRTETHDAFIDRLAKALKRRK
jgi:hypothetical protein